MKIEATDQFVKIFKKRFAHRANIQKKFDKRARVFAENHQDPLIKDHQLTGKLEGHRAFSVTGDVRVVYYIHEDTAYLIDIGTHNQVYGE